MLVLACLVAVISVVAGVVGIIGINTLPKEADPIRKKLSDGRLVQHD